MSSAAPRAGSRIALLGSVNVDRIWRLAAPLVAGARIRVDDRALRLGGGAVNTAVGVAEAGGAPVILSRVGSDALGEAALSKLTELGIDTASISRKDTPQTVLELLVGPDGDRTILYPPGDRELVTAVPDPATVDADALYVNMRRLADPERLAAWLERMPVVCQIPLGGAEPRPAHVLVASRDDLGASAAGDVWALGCRIAGAALRTVVITDGTRPVAIHEAGRVLTVPVPEPPLDGVDLTGAGDFFAAGLVAGVLRTEDIGAAVLEGCRVARAVLKRRPALHIAGER